MPKKKQYETVRITVTFPKAVHAQLAVQAEKERRNLSDQVVHLVEKALPQSQDR